MALRKPEWIKVKIQGSKETAKVNALISNLSLNTVCSEANCPNMMECFELGTATFMILGKHCTRNCQFCNVTTRKPEEVDLEEPTNVAKAVKQLGLKHAVITSVTRDDLEDEGANQFANVVKEIRRLAPGVTIELLIPDLHGRKELINLIIDTEPEILAHNVEMVPELYPEIMPQGDYEISLDVLDYVKKQKPNMRTKSSLMLGLGETKEQVVDVLKDLRQVDCDMVTFGQYLQPSKKHAAVVDYITPEEFDEYKEISFKMGFKKVESGPFVRSSYHAENF